MKEQVISGVPLFAALPPSEIQHLAETLQVVEFSAGTLLFREGDIGGHFYILLDGQVEIIKELDTADERLLGVREAGAVIGDMSLFSQEHRRTASVRARTSLQLLKMTRDDFDTLLHRQPTLAYDMVGVLSTRLYESENTTIRDLRQKNRELTQAYEELKAAQAQIIEKEKLEQELEVARQIQRSILPRELPQNSAYDFGARIEPMSAVGGDFYDFIPLGKDTIGIAMGDVSGHGVPAALFMAMTATLLRAESRRTNSPREALSNVNRQLVELNDTGMFVTVLYGILNCSTYEFNYVRAGHEPPIVYDAQGKLIEPKPGHGMLLGLFDHDNFDEQSVTIPSGTTLMLYTDGVSEAMDANKVMFGEERLREFVGAHRESSAQELCEHVLQQVTDHYGSIAQQDDITLLAVQVK